MTVVEKPTEKIYPGKCVLKPLTADTASVAVGGVQLTGVTTVPTGTVKAILLGQPVMTGGVVSTAVTVGNEKRLITGVLTNLSIKYM